MKYRILVALPLLFAAAFAVIMSVVGDPELAAIVERVEIELVKFLGLVGCAAAAFAFERGDYLRRAWMLSGVCLLLLLVRDLVFTLGVAGPTLLGVQSAHWQSAIVLAANLSFVAGTFLMARAWQVAGFEHAGSPWRRRTVVAVAVLVALAISGAALVIDVRGAIEGNPRALVGIASELGDMFSLVLIAPVLLTALAMRGGVLLWPWGLFTAAQLCWLFYDAMGTLGHFVSIDETRLRLLAEVFRALACTFTCAAGIAQRIAVTEVPAAVAAPR